MATKPSRVAAYNWELPLIKSHDPFITWSCDVDFSYTIVGLECKHLIRHQLFVQFY